MMMSVTELDGSRFNDHLTLSKITLPTFQSSCIDRGWIKRPPGDDSNQKV